MIKMGPHYRGFTITLRYTTLGRTPLDEWSARRRDFYLTTQLSQEKDIHAFGGIQTRSPSKRAAADLRPRCHCDRHFQLHVKFCGLYLLSFFY
jgi:hypothetical protein